VACGLRRHEIAELTVDHMQQREGHWAIVDLVGKGGHVRTIPVPDWVHCALNDWMQAACIKAGKLFRKVSSAGKPRGEGGTEKLVWHVKEFAKRIGNDSVSSRPCLGPNNRALPRLCPANCRRRKRQDWNRANILSWREPWKGARQSRCGGDTVYTLAVIYRDWRGASDRVNG
jgi:integrase